MLRYLPWTRQRITYVASADVQEQSEDWFRRNTVIDSAFSHTSKNALQNKVVTEVLGELNEPND